ncbi:MAG: Ig-like domain-containing protein [Planctomycetes bacterium]|nr:Ig-like domain-containing protein [Planctomycetota bacterium]
MSIQARLSRSLLLIFVVFGGFAYGAAPNLVDTSPRDEQKGVENSEMLMMLFDTDVDQGSGFITIYDQYGAQHTSIDITSATFSGNEVNFDPLDFGMDSTYSVNVDSGAIISLNSGDPWTGISDNTVWNFDTVKAGGTLTVNDILPTPPNISPSDNNVRIMNMSWDVTTASTNIESFAISLGAGGHHNVNQVELYIDGTLEGPGIIDGIGGMVFFENINLLQASSSSANIEVFADMNSTLYGNNLSVSFDPYIIHNRRIIMGSIGGTSVNSNFTFSSSIPDVLIIDPGMSHVEDTLNPNDYDLPVLSFTFHGMGSPTIDELHFDIPTGDLSVINNAKLRFQGTEYGTYNLNLANKRMSFTGLSRNIYDLSENVELFLDIVPDPVATTLNIQQNSSGANVIMGTGTYMGGNLQATVNVNQKELVVTESPMTLVDELTAGNTNVVVMALDLVSYGDITIDNLTFKVPEGHVDNLMNVQLFKDNSYHSTGTINSANKEITFSPTINLYSDSAYLEIKSDVHSDPFSGNIVLELDPISGIGTPTGIVTGSLIQHEFSVAGKSYIISEDNSFTPPPTLSAGQSDVEVMSFQIAATGGSISLNSDFVVTLPKGHTAFLDQAKLYKNDIWEEDANFQLDRNTFSFSSTPFNLTDETVTYSVNAFISASAPSTNIQVEIDPKNVDIMNGYAQGNIISEEFEISGTAFSPPELLSITPGDESIGVSVSSSSNFILGFNEDIQLGPNSVFLTLEGESTIIDDLSDSMRLSTSGNIAVYTPSTPMQMDEEYTLLMTYGALASVADGELWEGISDPEFLNFSTVESGGAITPSHLAISGSSANPGDSDVTIFAMDLAITDNVIIDELTFNSDQFSLINLASANLYSDNVYISEGFIDIDTSSIIFDGLWLNLLSSGNIEIHANMNSPTIYGNSLNVSFDSYNTNNYGLIKGTMGGMNINHTPTISGSTNKIIAVEKAVEGTLKYPSGGMGIPVMEMNLLGFGSTQIHSANVYVTSQNIDQIAGANLFIDNAQLGVANINTQANTLEFTSINHNIYDLTSSSMEVRIDAINDYPQSNITFSMAGGNILTDVGPVKGDPMTRTFTIEESAFTISDNTLFTADNLIPTNFQDVMKLKLSSDDGSTLDHLTVNISGPYASGDISGAELYNNNSYIMGGTVYGSPERIEFNSVYLSDTDNLSIRVNLNASVNEGTITFEIDPENDALLSMGTAGGNIISESIWVEGNPVPIYENPITMGIGQYFISYKTAANTLETEGINLKGALGIGSSASSPQQIGASTDWVGISVGAQHSLALNSAGNVYSWGDNSFGQLGHGDTNVRGTPVRINSLTNITKVCAGAYHSMALDDAGNVYAWGRGNLGALGNGTSGDEYSPGHLTQAILADGVTDIACGVDHSLMTVSGCIMACGSNGFMQLGTTDPAPVQLDPVYIYGYGEFVKVYAGGFHSAALTDTNDLYTWGKNNRGQCGLGNNNNQMTPTMISGFTNQIETFSAGYEHSLMVTTSGDLYATGSNDFEQFGMSGADMINFTHVDSSGWTEVQAGPYTSIGEKSGTIYVFGKQASPSFPAPMPPPP